MAAADSPAERSELEDALRYMRTVKASLEENRQPETYRQFVIVMANFKNGTIGVAEVTSRVAALFRDRADLIAGFNAMLPRGDEIQVVPGVNEHELAARFVRDVNLDEHDADMIN